MMDFKKKYYPESNFGGFSDIDGTIAFYLRINSLIQKENIILDVGCGRGKYKDDKIDLRRNLRNFRGDVNKVIGIDVDQSAHNNPFIDEFRVIEGNFWPVDDCSVNICIADYVLEHIEEPYQFFSEAYRVLKNGGYFCIRTPNKWGYPYIAARLIPERLHIKIVPTVQQDREEIDIFPTIYNCNTKTKLKRLFKDHGFCYTVYNYEPEPAYLNFSRFFYATGVFFQKYAPNALKTTIFGYGKKI